MESSTDEEASEVETSGDVSEVETSGDGNAAETPGDSSAGEAPGREVEVPLRLYKTVTVFSTLFAVAFVVGGFVVLDTATRRGRVSPSEVDLPLAVLGVAMIAAGAVVYAFATRFRAEGMGKSKDDADEQ